MKSPEKPVALPLDYATELALEMHMMRAECCDAAFNVVREPPVDNAALEECAILDEALAKAQALLQSAVATIHELRILRGLGDPPGK
jgi:hypothetical protein